MPRQHATIFVNGSSGWNSKENAPQLLEKLFEDASVDTKIEYVQQGVNLAQLSRQAFVDGSRIIIAGGGDGTLSATAAGIVGTDAVFGVLPVGTLNHFARDLKIPLDIERAVKVILAGHTTEVDVGEVNGKTFLNNSILGLYPIYRFLRAEEERRGWGKRMSFLRGVAKIIYRTPNLHVRLFVNGQEIERRTPYILVGNNEHAMEGYNLGFRDTLCDGKLWIYVMKNRSRWGLLRLLLRLAIGRFHADKDFEIFSTEEAWVETNGRRVGVALDGEVTVLESPLHYRVLPRSLNVLTPRPPQSPSDMRPLRLVEEEEKPPSSPALSPLPA